MKATPCPRCGKFGGDGHTCTPKKIREAAAADAPSPFLTFVERLGEPCAKNLLDRLNAFVDDAAFFDVLAHASFLEGTLILPSGRRVQFEWDKDDPMAGTLRDVMRGFLVADGVMQRAKETRDA